MKEYVIVSQFEPQVEILRRQESGEWLLSEYSGIEATCHFSSINCDIAMAGIYYKIVFDRQTEGEAHPSAPR